MFSNNEYADIHLVLGECRNNATAAARVYRERYPLRRHPSSNVCRRLDHRIRETGSVVPKGVFYRDRGRPRIARKPQIEDNVLDLLDENPTSSCDIALRLDASHSLVSRIIKDERLHPFHYTQVQALLPADFPIREHFCSGCCSRYKETHNLVKIFYGLMKQIFHENAFSIFEILIFIHFKIPIYVGQ
jgi:hypothetical protein